MSWRAELASVVVAAPVAIMLAARRPPALIRTAASGRRPTLAAGPATVCGLLAGLIAHASAAGAPAAGPRAGDRRAGDRRAGDRRAALLAVLTAGAAGLLDDLGEPLLAGGVVGTPARGFSGHLGALAGGRVTTGLVKTVVIGAGGFAGALALARDRPRRGPAAWRRVATDTALIAGTANLVNLFDLRPGRAGKVALLADGWLVAAGAGGAPGLLGCLAVTEGADLRGLWMLGDTGANALGAALGARVAASGGPLTRGCWLALVLGLTAAGERVSFTDVIARHRLLRTADELGRR